MRPLVWFRSDVRTADHPALHAAARAATRGVVAVFTITPKQWIAHDMAPARVDFILRSLIELSERLAARNVALKIVTTPTFAGVPGCLRAIAETHECDALFFNNEYEVNERRRDEAVTEKFEKLGLTVHASTDQCVFEPGTLLTGTGGFYTVFTPFKRAWEKRVAQDPARIDPLGLPKKQPEMVSTPDEIPRTVAGFDLSSARPDLWPAGETEARRRLRSFTRARIEAYATQRDHPAVNGTSTLSPYLVSGAISLRMCIDAAAHATEGSVVGPWTTELVWREFYKHVLIGFPHVSMHRAFKPETERIIWNDDESHFDAWCAGRTGYPLVDAAMRQLVQTGWMHNRLRMIVAMFLSKNLFLDWRRGEQYFMRHLIDGDLAANNGGWQWSASTGTDAAPYFRIFNPISQSKRFDADGAFIRRFVPELADLPDRLIHEPPPLSRAAAEYPEPIVDHTSTRAHAIEMFKQLKSATGPA